MQFWWWASAYIIIHGLDYCISIHLGHGWCMVQVQNLVPPFPASYYVPDHHLTMGCFYLFEVWRRKCLRFVCLVWQAVNLKIWEYVHFFHVVILMPKSFIFWYKCWMNGYRWATFSVFCYKQAPSTLVVQIPSIDCQIGKFYLLLISLAYSLLYTNSFSLQLVSEFREYICVHSIT